MSNYRAFAVNGVDMSGFREIRIRSRECVRSAKARTGTGHVKRGRKNVDSLYGLIPVQFRWKFGRPFPAHLPKGAAQTILRRHMPRQRFWYGFGPPFSYIADRLLQEEQFREELRQIARLPEEKFSAISSALQAHPNFLVSTDVAAILKKNLPEPDAESITRTLLRVNRTIRNTQETAKEALGIFVAAMAEQSKEFPPETIQILEPRLNALILMPRGFSRQKKAEELAEATGADLTEFNIICDIRPVFDEDRKEIEGALAVTTLTLDILQLDGRVASIECRLTENQLDDIIRKSTAAKQKVVAIKALLATKMISQTRALEPRTGK